MPLELKLDEADPVMLAKSARLGDSTGMDDAAELGIRLDVFDVVAFVAAKLGSLTGKIITIKHY
jgi:hypothetical protein